MLNKFFFFPLDVNECESGSHNCSENGVCHNVPGGYNCSCAAGYIGDGFKCTGRLLFEAELFCLWCAGLYH